MELPADQKRAILQSCLQQLEQQRYTSEVMGQTWQTIGNAELAKANADKLAECIKAIAELNKKIAELQ